MDNAQNCLQCYIRLSCKYLTLSGGSGFLWFFKPISDSAKGVADWFKKNMFTQVEPVLQQIQAVVGQVTDSLVTIASGVLKTIFNILYEIGKFILM